jgi:hypothetical protein
LDRPAIDAESARIAECAPQSGSRFGRDLLGLAE